MGKMVVTWGYEGWDSGVPKPFIGLNPIYHSHTRDWGVGGTRPQGSSTGRTRTEQNGVGSGVRLYMCESFLIILTTVRYGLGGYPQSPRLGMERGVLGAKLLLCMYLGAPRNPTGPPHIPFIPS